jgi:DNA-directed RNA polymerase subunit RPC12/RpoP
MFECMECGRKFYSVAAANKAAFGDNGCPGCGGSDIDLPRPKVDEHWSGDMAEMIAERRSDGAE